MAKKVMDMEFDITEEAIEQLEKDFAKRPIKEIIAYNSDQLKEAVQKIGFPCILREAT